MGKTQRLEIIVPVYNEQSCIPELMRRLMALRTKLKGLDTSFIFVNDGSKDQSLPILLSFAAKHPCVKVIDLSRNFGHQMALTAAIDHASADYVAIIDADLQDPPELIERMVQLARKGNDIVYGQRQDREKETWFKLATAKLFYRLLNRLSDVEIPADTGDFRLITKPVVDVLKRMRERHRYLRGMIPWTGFKSVALPYQRKARHAGTTHYPLRKMLRFAKDGMFSFSNIPLRVATYLGLFVFGLGILGGIYLIYMNLARHISVPGITSTTLTIIIMSGIQIIMIGVVGEYIGRIFEEVKGRPLYIVRDAVNLPLRERQAPTDHAPDHPRQTAR